MNLEKYTLNEDFDILATWYKKDQKSRRRNKRYFALWTIFYYS